MKYIDEAYRLHTVDLLSNTNVGEKVFGTHQEPVEKPVVNFYHIATVQLPGDTLSGDDGIAKIVIQNSVMADTKVECRDIMNLIMDDWKPKKEVQKRTIGRDGYFVNIEYSRITTRQVVFDPNIKNYHGILDLVIVYRED